MLARLAGDDGFAFEVQRGRRLTPRMAGGDGWRLTVRCTAHGSEVSRVRVDVVARGEELSGAVSQLLIPPPVPSLGLSAVFMSAVDVAQHAAEKVHAMDRTYAGDLPSSRVKDLIDLVLLVDAGLLPDSRWGERLIALYRIRDGAKPPGTLPEPPPAWRRDYPELAAQTGASASRLEDAFHLVAPLYAGAMAQAEHVDDRPEDAQ
jgi:Nucleotidyl transferase AbiEii toxin, Type IV TA system